MKTETFDEMMIRVSKGMADKWDDEDVLRFIDLLLCHKTCQWIKTNGRAPELESDDETENKFAQWVEETSNRKDADIKRILLKAAEDGWDKPNNGDSEYYDTDYKNKDLLKAFKAFTTQRL